MAHSVKTTQSGAAFYVPAEHAPAYPAEQSVDALAQELNIEANPAEVRAELDKDRSVDDLAMDLGLVRTRRAVVVEEDHSALLDKIPELSLSAAAPIGAAAPIRTKTRTLGAGADGEVPTASIVDLPLTARTREKLDDKDKERAKEMREKGEGRTTVADKVQRSFSGAKKASGRAPQAAGTPKAAHTNRKPVVLKSSLSDATKV